MRILLLFTTTFLSLILFSQNYEVGHTTITFNDPGRTGGFGSGGGSGRQIQTEIYYPADMAGTDVTAAMGEFPVIVFGHGFSMAWDAYENIWAELVPKGYIMAFPRTEGSFMPSHEEFGFDLALVETKIQAENSNSGGLFYNHVSPNSAIMGHSMGGGASFLAASGNSSIQTVIGLAPAETNPSAVAAVANVSVPTLIFSADEDAVTPAADHHLAIYNGVSNACKYFVSINGGGHCYYANSDFNCDFGEGTSGGNISITRQEQQDVMFRYLIPWLKLYLKNDCAQYDIFTNDLSSDADVTIQSVCSTVFPAIDVNVTVNGISLSSDQAGAGYQWLDCNIGNSAISNETNQVFQATQNGSYAVEVSVGMCKDTSNCVDISTIGIKEEKVGLLKVYPNPNKGAFFVQSNQKWNIKITSPNGSVVFEDEVYPGENQIKTELETGVYLVHFYSDQEYIIRQIFITLGQ